uniref:Uncharacterized protein n=1 Tax=Brassica oleracea var. oleracea TaxID=109376 RepID=A0A0D2ZZP3_BRAOL
MYVTPLKLAMRMLHKLVRRSSSLRPSLLDPGTCLKSIRTQWLYAVGMRILISLSLSVLILIGWNSVTILMRMEVIPLIVDLT